MLSDPMAVTLAAPDDNTRYWEALISTYQRVRKSLLSNNCLYPLNISLEKALWNIKYAYPPEIALQLAWREIKLRKKVRAKKAANYKTDEPDFDFEDIKVNCEVLPAHVNEKSILDTVREQTAVHYKSFQRLTPGIIFNEVMSEVFLVAAKCANKFDPTGKASFKTYLSRAISNHITDRWRKKKREKELGVDFVSYCDETVYNTKYPQLVNGRYIAGGCDQIYV
ncbi:sigma factor [Pseudodesulfovibrio karagichevae]|uniref:Sigma factor n=1 Tax=Pseudodesulfovibrio karagichevae TaxID=3239305 RepID=A0ABV4K950_9BACT